MKSSQQKTLKGALSTNTSKRSEFVSSQVQARSQEKVKINVKASQINSILKSIAGEWTQRWSYNIQVLQNKINTYINNQIMLEPHNPSTSFSQLMGTDILQINQDPHQRLVIVEFHQQLRKPQPILRQPLHTVDSMNSPLAHIDTDFSLLVFKIANDHPFLLHYLPRLPDLIAFSDYSDSFDKSPTSGFKFEFKQLNWMIHTHAKADKVSGTVMPLGIELQLAFLNQSWYLLLPSQNCRKTLSLNIPEIISITAEQTNNNLDWLQNPVNRQKYYRYIVIRETLLELHRKLLPETPISNTNLTLVLDSLNPTLIYNLLLQSQILTNFPIQKPGLFILSVHQRVELADQDLTISDSEKQETLLAPYKCLQYEHTEDLTNNLSITSIKSLVYKTKWPYNVTINIYKNDESGTPQLNKVFRLTTQLYLFVQLCSLHLEVLKCPDDLSNIKDLVALYNTPPQQQNNTKPQTQQEVPKFQKIRYPVSKLFITDLQQTFSDQQQLFNEFLLKFEKHLGQLKLQQILELFIKYSESLDQPPVQQSHTKQQLINCFLQLVKQNNNSIVVSAFLD